MAKVGATNEEIAAVCKVSSDTIVRRYAELIAEGRSGAKLSVRRELMSRMKKSDAVLIHLSKAFCGNSEQAELINRIEALEKLITKQGEENESTD